MTPDQGLEDTRSVREKISRGFGNDPRRLVEYYIKYQEQFGTRLRRAPASDQGPNEAAEQADAADAPSARR